MRNTARLAAATLLLACAPLASTLALAKDPAKIAVTPQSTTAVLVLKTDQIRPAPSFKTAYRIGLSTYDPEHEAMKGGPYGGKATFAAIPKLFREGYLIIEVKPGTWVFQDFEMQDFWALCFNANSLRFDVRAGEVVYLGQMAAQAHGVELLRTATLTGRTSVRGNQQAHFFDMPAPRIAAPSEADLPGIAAMLRRNVPRTTAPLRTASFAPARFGTGRNLFGFDRICGGYFTSSATPDPEPKPAP